MASHQIPPGSIDLQGIFRANINQMDTLVFMLKCCLHLKRKEAEEHILDTLVDHEFSRENQIASLGVCRSRGKALGQVFPNVLGISNPMQQGNSGLFGLKASANGSLMVTQ